MPARRLRTALAAALVAPLLVGPVVAEAVSVPLRCKGATQEGLFQRLPIAEFRGVPGVTTSGSVSAYSVDAARPERLLVTNGTTVQQTTSAGCTWKDVLVLGQSGDDGVPLSGSTSSIVATASLPGGPSLVAVREGTSAASRPHVASSPDGARGTWRETSDGLPAQGSPQLLEPAGTSSTAYLTLQATGGGAVPALPGVGAPPPAPAGFLYATTNGGRSWTQRSTVADLPAGVTSFDALAVDAGDPQLLYAVAEGRLVLSRDGGRSFTVEPSLTGVTAVEPMEPGEVAVLAGTTLQHSRDGGRSFAERPAPAGARSAAYRKGDGGLLVEADGTLFRVQARSKGGPAELDAGVPATAGSARGDRAEGGTFHALAGNALLRYVDPISQELPGTPRAPGDLTVPPPPPGRMDPPSRGVTLPVGESREVDFTLVLPKSPTPLDLYLLVDVSEGMTNFLRDVKENLGRVAQEVEAQGIDLRVGVGTVGPGPREGEAPYPDVDPGDPDYRKPDVYRRVRQIGEVNRDLDAAVDAIAIQAPPQGRRGNNPPEGQLAGLDQVIEGQGFADERLGGAATGSYVIAPGQQAEFRDAPGIRRFVALATNEDFTDPYGTPMTAGRPDLEGVGRRLAEAGIKVIGLTAQEGAKSKPDLETMARLTGTFAPAGGIDCGDEVFVAEGEPLVCDSSSKIAEVVPQALRGLADRQSVALVRRGPDTLLGGVQAGGLQDLDVTVRNDIPFSVRVSCVDVAAGTYTPSVDAVLRETVVATAKLTVVCTAPVAAAVVPPPKPPAQLQEPAAPAGQPAAQAPAPPAPAPPVVQPQAQPQVQGQVQAQVNPVSAAVLQQQQELQLALALSADERPSTGTEYAMVDRGRGEQLRAQALLATAMAGASVLGLARLRTRRSALVRRAR